MVTGTEQSAVKQVCEISFKARCVMKHPILQVVPICVSSCSFNQLMQLKLNEEVESCNQALH